MSWARQAGIILPGYNPLQVANAPTIGTATAGNSSCASVTFTAPTCVGGSVITTYTAFSNCGTKSITGASSPLTVTGLVAGTAYTFRVIATNIYGPSYPSAASNSITAKNAGQQAYTTAGTYSWVAPTGVNKVSVVAVGPGGSGPNCSLANYIPGGGGGLGYKNNISVTPGNSYTVVVGDSSTGTANGTDSYFCSTSVVKGGAGGRMTTAGQYRGLGGTYTGDGGGNGGDGGTWSGCYGSNRGAGGGAGGYSGNGGNGAAGAATGQTGSSGSGGGGGGGGTNNFRQSAAGGGVGILGSGSNGAGGGFTGAGSSRKGLGGGGGSGGTNGQDGCTACAPAGSTGGNYGGGGFGAGSGKFGGNGAVRIIWPGCSRSFPSTCTGNL